MILHGDHRPDLLRDETLAQLWAASVAAHGRRCAIEDGATTLTYAALDARATAAAARLAALGIGPGAVVGLWLERGAALFALQIAVARRGAAWLPLDPAAPPARAAACLDGTGAALLVHDGGHAPPAGVPAAAAGALLAAGAAAVPDAAPDPDAPAYLIATSGTTGAPKAIAVSHRSICHFLRSENALLGVAAGDRVYQGFSPSFDMSFEEVWIAWLAGATLWVAPPATANDPEAVGAALERERISVLHAVPSLAALIPGELPGLRLLNLGGEACPAAVAARWCTPGRRVFNTYGPTEATVSASAAELRAGEEVTIGRPLPNYGLAVVDAGLRPVGAGVEGELCIFGPGLALGYHGRGDLTAERFPCGPFPHLPGIGRLYRTGDLACAGADGTVRFRGRIDDQVKVRGFRVELGAVEAALAGCPGVRAAAALAVDGELAAALVGGDEDDQALRRRLGGQLPPYMVPTRLVRLAALPRQASGKVDRRALAALLPAAPAADPAAPSPAAGALGAVLAAAAAVLPGRSPAAGDGFFADLGGHSLAAARLVSLLRTRGFPGAAVRLVYAHPRLGDLAAALEATATTGAGGAPLPPAAPPPRRRRAWCGLAMVLLLPVPVCLHLAAWLAPFFTYHILTGDEGDSVWLAMAAALAAFVLAQGAPFAAALAAKWLVLGRMPAGRHPLWGGLHLRWWFADVMQRAAPAWLLHGTPLLPAWLRLLGARIGRDAHLAGIEVRAPDLLEIGPGAALGAGVLAANVRFEGAHLVAGGIAVGAGAVVGSGSVLEGPCRLDDGAELGDLSALRAGTSVPAGGRWEGADARRAGAAPADPPQPGPGPLRRLGEALLYPLAALALATLFFLPVFPAFMLIDWLDGAWLDSYGGAVHTAVATLAYLALGVPAAAVLVAATLALAAAARRLLCRGLRPGRWSLHGAMYYRKWLSDQVQENSLQLLHGLYATVYAPWWFRLVGVRVGRGAEISTATGITPELLELGERSFVADGALLGDEQVRGGAMTLLGTRVGADAFVGNGACVPDGADLPAGCLIGVQTLAPPAAALAPGQTWMGSPALLLPAREVHGGHPAALTTAPTRARWCARAAIELARIVVPLAFVMAYGYLAVHLVVPLIEAEEWPRALLAMAGLGFLYGLASVAAVLAAKWLLVGRYRPRAAPMWTPFVWLSEAVTAVYESLAVPNLLDFLRATPLLPVFLRLHGARIGRDTVLDSTDLTEFDCVEIGDGAVLNADCGPQTHLFEDRVMTVGAVSIGAGAVVGARAIVLYDAEVGAGVRLAPLTLVAKGERLPPGGAWAGAPAVPA